MKLLLQYLSRYKGYVFLTLLLAALDQGFINLNPYILGNFLIDPYANKVAYYRQHGLSREFFTGITLGIMKIVAVSTIAWVANIFQKYILNSIIRRIGADLYADVQSHILHLPYHDFEDQRSGEILSILQRARQDCENFITRFMDVLFASIIAIVIVTVISIPLSPLLPVVYLGGVIMLSIITNLLSWKMRTVQKEILDATNALAGSTTESLRNMELVKSLGLVGQETKRLNGINFKILKRELVKIKNIRSLSALYGAFIQTFHQAIIFTLLVFLFYNRLTVGQLIMMQLYFYSLFGGLGQLGSVIVAYRDAEASLNNLRAILSKPAEHQPLHPEKIGPITCFRFEQVRFQHKTAIRPALADISFEAGQGETIAFVGPSGSGKTTLVKLLVGLYHPSAGKIYYNGHCHDRIDYDELRHQTGLVTQDAQLFSGTIKDNLLFVNPEATDKMIGDVLNRASCQNLLARAPKGFDTMIGESGLKLSGGERQRLAIARAMLRQSRLLIFDEATSSLDSLTEKEIADTIHHITDKQQNITIMIAHRLSTIMFADRIYVLDAGSIVETGSHHSLLAAKGLYFAMWQQQTGEWKESSPKSLIYG